MNSAITAFAIIAIVAASTASASSHSEAPGTAGNPSSDLTDFYAFKSYEEGREDRVVFIMNLQPLQSPFAGPNYYSLSDLHYIDLNIDNDGDALPDITLRVRPGHSLGGPLGNDTLINDVDANCSDYSLQLMNVTRRTGITLPVGEGEQLRNVKVPLKFVGPLADVNDTNLNWFEWVEIERINGDGSSAGQVTTAGDESDIEFELPFDYVGTKTFADYEAYASQFVHEINIPGCGEPARLFVGQRKESFSIQLGRIFDLVNLDPINVKTCPENNRLDGNNVATVALEIPQSCVLADGADTFGSWAVVRNLHHQRAADGVSEDHVPGRQVSRLGQVLVNELVVGLGDKGKFSYSPPSEDGQFLEYVTHPTLPEIINLLFGGGSRIAPTNIPRMDLVQVFLLGLPGINAFGGAAEYVRLNTSIAAVAPAQQSNLGVIGGDAAGFPNGRRPGDDVVDIALRVVMGRLCHLGLGLCEPGDAPAGTIDFSDGAPQNAGQFDGSFPFLTTPNPGAETDPNQDLCDADLPENPCTVAIAGCNAANGGVCNSATTSTLGKTLTLRFAETENCDE